MNKAVLFYIHISILWRFFMTLEHNENGFDVIGIAIRTTNKDAISKDTITQLWERFFTENALAKIPNKLNDTMVALYYNYENKRDGAYDILVGVPVSSIDQIPEGMIAKHVPAAKRMVLASEVGPVGQVVLDLWKEIWAWEDDNEITRTYEVDYELYDARCRDTQKAQVDVHIGVK